MNFNNFRSKPELDDYEIASMTVIPDSTFTVTQAINYLGFGWFQIKLSLWTGLCWMTDSMEMTILSLLPYMWGCKWEISNLQQALMTSVVFFGMVISSRFWSLFSNKYGRKMALNVCCLGVTIFAIFSSKSESFYNFLLWRFLIGVMVGCVPQSVSLYAEFLPKKQRAKCVALLDCFWTLGSCFEIILTFVVLQTLDWKWLLIISTLPLFTFTLITSNLPESTKFWLEKDRMDMAVKTLQKVASDNSKNFPDGRLVMDDTEDYKTHKKIQDLLHTGLKYLTLNVWFIWFTCAFCYYGLVLASPGILHMSRHGSETCPQLDPSDYIDLLWISISEFLGIFLALEIIKIIGPKNALVILFLAHASSFGLLLLVTNHMLVILALFLSRATIAGIFQAVYALTPDLFSPNLSMIAVNSSSTMARLGAILTPFMAQLFVKTVPTIVIGGYTLLALIGSVCCYKLPNELKSTNSAIPKLPIVDVQQNCFY